MEKLPLAPRESRLAGITEAMVMAFGRSPVIGVLGIGLMFSAFTAGAHLLTFPWLQNGVAIIVLGLFTLLVFEMAQRLARRNVPVAIAPFLATSLVVGLTLRLLYVGYIRPEWYSDFLSYWQTGVELAHASEVTVHDIYDQRAYFLTRPIVEVFGESRTALVAINALLLTFIQGVGYDLARRARNHQAAQAFSVLWIAVPEPLLTAAVPNHDLAGLTLAAAALWLLTVAQGTLALRRVALSATAGIALALLEATRGLGLVFSAVLVALALAAVVVQSARQGRAGFANQSVRRAGVTLLITLISLTVTLSALSRAGVTIDSATSTYLTVRYTTPHSTSLSPGSHSFYAAFTKAFTQDLEQSVEQDVEKFFEFRRSLVLSDFLAAPLTRLQAPIFRMQRQYALGSQQNFYLRGTPQVVRSTAAVYTDFFRLGFAVLLLIAIYRHLRRPVHRVTLTDFLLLFVATTSMALLLFGESQPRYLFFIWFAGALVIPLQARSKDEEPITHRSPTLLLISAFAALGSLALLAFVSANGNLKDYNGRILSRWQFSHDLNDVASGNALLAGLQNESSNVLVDAKEKPMPTRFGALSLKLMLPAPPAIARVAAARTQICGIRPSSALEFQFATPSQGKAGSFSLHLTADGKSIWQAPLPNGRTPERVTVALPGGTDDCAQLEFSLHSHTDQSKRSWQRASFVEIFFPRIVRAPSQSVSAPY